MVRLVLYSKCLNIYIFCYQADAKIFNSSSTLHKNVKAISIIEKNKGNYMEKSRWIWWNNVLDLNGRKPQR